MAWMLLGSRLGEITVSSPARTGRPRGHAARDSTPPWRTTSGRTPAPARPLRPPGRKQKEKTMIFHINLFTIKPGDEPREKGLDLMRQVGANPAVKSYVVGPELGGVRVRRGVRGRGPRQLLGLPGVPGACAPGAVGHPVPGEVRGHRRLRFRGSGARREDRRAAGPPPARAP